MIYLCFQLLGRVKVGKDEDIGDIVYGETSAQGLFAHHLQSLQGIPAIPHFKEHSEESKGVPTCSSSKMSKRESSYLSAAASKSLAMVSKQACVLPV